ncbi:hypothetical protein P7K49_039128 [Saguinus oedipus]|uniref:Uncharacterized protein n=1 Tax=Saguinus oedipus TaxID=9490 RepID=A0ABQ9TGM3_SAGOE|nr:hypothetical protein P7K49_039128 [Saguinus oedipus]
MPSAAKVDARGTPIPRQRGATLPQDIATSALELMQVRSSCYCQNSNAKPEMLHGSSDVLRVVASQKPIKCDLKPERWRMLPRTETATRVTSVRGEVSSFPLASKKKALRFFAEKSLKKSIDLLTQEKSVAFQCRRLLTGLHGAEFKSAANTTPPLALASSKPILFERHIRKEPLLQRWTAGHKLMCLSLETLAKENDICSKASSHMPCHDVTAKTRGVEGCLCLVGVHVQTEQKQEEVRLQLPTGLRGSSGWWDS